MPAAEHNIYSTNAAHKLYPFYLLIVSFIEGYPLLIIFKIIIIKVGRKKLHKLI